MRAKPLRHLAHYFFIDFFLSPTCHPRVIDFIFYILNCIPTRNSNYLFCTWPLRTFKFLVFVFSYVKLKNNPQLNTSYIVSVSSVYRQSDKDIQGYYNKTIHVLHDVSGVGRWDVTWPDDVIGRQLNITLLQETDEVINSARQDSGKERLYF